jgi:hypothetical protein
MSSSSAFCLTTIVAPGGAPDLAQVAKQLGVEVHDIDSTFGVVPIDPERGMYAVQVRGDKLAARPESSKSGEHTGPWSNPRIEPFGPVRDSKKDK